VSAQGEREGGDELENVNPVDVLHRSSVEGRNEEKTQPEAAPIKPGDRRTSVWFANSHMLRAQQALGRNRRSDVLRVECIDLARHSPQDFVDKDANSAQRVILGHPLRGGHM
jgi:hypothetical protein